MPCAASPPSSSGALRAHGANGHRQKLTREGRRRHRGAQCAVRSGAGGQARTVLPGRRGPQRAGWPGPGHAVQPSQALRPGMQRPGRRTTAAEEPAPSCWQGGAHVPLPGVASVVRSGAALRSSLGPRGGNSRKSLRNGCPRGAGARFEARVLFGENEEEARAATATGANGSYGLVGRSLSRLGDRSTAPPSSCRWTFKIERRWYLYWPPIFVLFVCTKQNPSPVIFEPRWVQPCGLGSPRIGCAEGDTVDESVCA